MMNDNKKLRENKALTDEELENVSGGALLVATEERKPFLDLSDEACEAIPNDAT